MFVSYIINHTGEGFGRYRGVPEFIFFAHQIHKRKYAALEPLGASHKFRNHSSMSCSNSRVP